MFEIAGQDTVENITTSQVMGSWGQWALCGAHPRHVCGALRTGIPDHGHILEHGHILDTYAAHCARECPETTMRRLQLDQLVHMIRVHGCDAKEHAESQGLPQLGNDLT